MFLLRNKNKIYMDSIDFSKAVNFKGIPTSPYTDTARSGPKLLIMAILQDHNTFESDPVHFEQNYTG